MSPGTARPLCVATPANASHVQAAVLCGRRHGVRLRVRSGGHDLEGLSYRSAARADDEDGAAFAVLDLAGLRAVRVDVEAATSWVDSGATVGELYYAVGKASGDRLAFPAGLCPTIGVGGHLSGGGFGMLLRKYGVAADHVVDALLVDARGRLLDKDGMGADVFWAIRGGGGASFGVVLSWQVRLVPVPPVVTVFKVPVSVDRGAVGVLTRWQTAAPAFPDDLFVRVVVQGQVAEFQSLYLGTCAALLPVMRSRLPELGLDRTHCREMTWLQSVPYIYLGSGACRETGRLR
jgi:FAD/FMN-containing dehydrogenase